MYECCVHLHVLLCSSIWTLLAEIWPEHLHVNNWSALSRNSKCKFEDIFQLESLLEGFVLECVCFRWKIMSQNRRTSHLSRTWISYGRQLEEIVVLTEMFYLAWITKGWANKLAPEQELGSDITEGEGENWRRCQEIKPFAIILGHYKCGETAKIHSSPDP